MDYFGRPDGSLETFKDEAYDKAVGSFPIGSWVYIVPTKQLGIVEEVRPSPDGPRLKIVNIGSVPVGELRVATEEEIKKHLGS